MEFLTGRPLIFVTPAKFGGSVQVFSGGWPHGEGERLAFRGICGRDQAGMLDPAGHIGPRAELDEHHGHRSSAVGRLFRPGDDMRRRLLASFSQTYPRLVLDHFEQGSCLGCEFEVRFGNVTEILRAIEELVNGLMHSIC